MAQSANPVTIEIVGSLNMDLVSITSRMPRAGETLQANSFSAGYGGKGANQAVACARLLRNAHGEPAKDGIRVRMHGAVGSGDALGSSGYVEYLSKEGIDVTGITRKTGVPTGTAVIIVEEDSGENRILITPGANGEVHASDIKLDESPGGFVLFQMEIPLETTIESIRRAKSMGKTVILNVAPATHLPDEVYQDLDHLHVNESEAAMLTGISADEVVEDVSKVGRFFRNKGVKNVVVTLGAKGIYCLDAHNNEIRVPIIKCKAIDTTAAGDTFAGGYCAWLAMKDPTDVEGALRFANRAAGLSVQKRGAQASMPYLSEVLDE